MNCSKKRVFEDAFKNLAKLYSQTRQQAPVVDSMFVKNIFGKEVVGRNHTDRGRNAVKVSLLTDTSGIPLAATYQMPNKHDSTTLNHLLDAAKRILPHDLSLHGALYADKGYDSQTCRVACMCRGLAPMIPRRGSTDRLGLIRYVIETTFGKLD